MIKKHYLKEINIAKPVKTGSKGEDVKKVQEWLNLWRVYDKNWYNNVTVDGDFGWQSSEAVKEFQQKRGLTVDGIVGPKTFRIIVQPMVSAFTYVIGDDLRQLIEDYAVQHLENEPRELYNNNQGPWVRAYMDGNEGRPWAWCMGFVQTILDQAFFSLGKNFTSIMPKTYSCDVVGEYGKEKGTLIRNAQLRSNPELIEKGDVFLIVKTPNDWTHTGIVTGVADDWILTIEGNTNDEGSREGFEVCRRKRNFRRTNIDIVKVG
jgi:hypothetical protein